MYRYSAIFYLIFIICAPDCKLRAENSPAIKSVINRKSASLNPNFTYRGWEYIVQKLIKDGVDKKIVNSIYLNEKMPALEDVSFKIKPQETPLIYEGFKNQKLINDAALYLKNNKTDFTKAEKRFGVSRNVIVSIMLVETHLGANTGNSLIINRLSRVGSIAKPEIIKENYERLLKEDKTVTYKEVEDRAIYLESRFYPEVLALIKISRKYKIDLMNLKGSFAGAFGIPQFLPSTFLNYAVDGNKDGTISLFNKSDAIYSIANYLSKLGWKDNASQKQKESVIWQYNHSQPYIDTVLYIAGKLGRH